MCNMIDEHKPKSKIEFLQIIDEIYKRKYENVNIMIECEGLEVEYDLIESETEDPTLTEHFLTACMGSEIQEINNKHHACFIPYPDF